MHPADHSMLVGGGRPGSTGRLPYQRLADAATSFALIVGYAARPDRGRAACALLGANPNGRGAPKSRESDMRAMTGQLGRGDAATMSFPLAIIAAHLGRIDEALETRSQNASARADAAGIPTVQLGMSGCSASLSSRSAMPRQRSKPATVVRPSQRVHARTGDACRARRPARGARRPMWTRRGRRHPRDLGGPGGSARPRLRRLARCRALLLAAHGDLDGALACFERSIAEHAWDVTLFCGHGRCSPKGDVRRVQEATPRRPGDLGERIFGRIRASRRTALGGAGPRRARSGIGGRAPSRNELTEADGIQPRRRRQDQP